jgi:hypothetical protein
MTLPCDWLKDGELAAGVSDAVDSDLCPFCFLRPQHAGILNRCSDRRPGGMGLRHCRRVTRKHESGETAGYRALDDRIVRTWGVNARFAIA